MPIVGGFDAAYLEGCWQEKGIRLFGEQTGEAGGFCVSGTLPRRDFMGLCKGGMWVLENLINRMYLSENLRRQGAVVLKSRIIYNRRIVIFYLYLHLRIC